MEAVFVGEAGVGRSDHAHACVEPVEHLDRFGIAAPQPHLALDRAGAVGGDHEHPVAAGFVVEGARSEEHTSELQSLMRISYAVFCLKKKKTRTHTQHKHTPTEHSTTHI